MVFEFILRHLNSIGLVIDIIGVCLVAVSLSKVNRSGERIGFFANSESVKNYEKNDKKYKLFDKMGLILIILGFVLQIIYNFIPPQSAP